MHIIITLEKTGMTPLETKRVCFIHGLSSYPAVNTLQKTKPIL